MATFVLLMQILQYLLLCIHDFLGKVWFGKIQPLIFDEYVWPAVIALYSWLTKQNIIIGRQNVLNCNENNAAMLKL